ncbi:putative F-box protein At2g02030 [Papaver somniferum]|uniref:putative F-box protein At2g02030 n=1 Tax=Papaver somniferum TaxID=3469 RepID=UPI000E6F7460|nr:putative F-box protein At2g02030 [Papaver somniferum]
MENLHSDIIENILSRLSIEAALHAKRVCTTWREILRCKTEKPGFFFGLSRKVKREGGVSKSRISRKRFFYEDEYDHYDHAKMNYYHSYNTLSEIQHGRFITKYLSRYIMVGSCHGLVCFRKSNEHTQGAIDPFLIRNPLIGELIVLPEYNYSDQLPTDISSTTPPTSRLTSGFGYCPSTNSYKVVTIYYYHGKNKGHVQVYTVGREWRYIGFIVRPYSLDYFSGIYANGALYWLHDKVQNCETVAFELEAETFDYIPLPSSVDSEYKDYSLSVLHLLGANNKLYLFHKTYQASRTDIWVYMSNNTSIGTNNTITMKECNQEEKYHDRGSPCWIKRFSIRWEVPFFTPFAITRSNEVLLWKCVGPRLYCYDPNTSTLKRLWDGTAKGTKWDYVEAIPHRQSIVSLKDLGEKNVTSLKDLEKLMLQASSKDSGEGDVTVYESATIPSTETRDAKRSKNC